MCQRQASDFAFWKFIQLRDPGECSFNLAFLLDLYSGDKKDEVLGHLLRSQASAVNELIFEKLRSQSSLEFARKTIPVDRLRAENFMDEKKWHLVCKQKKRMSQGVMTWGCGQLRHPSPGKGPVDCSGFACSSRFGAAIMVDLQRVIACMDISAEDGSGNTEFLLQVAQASDAFSSRVVTPMSAQSEWRKAEGFAGASLWAVLFHRLI